MDDRETIESNIDLNNEVKQKITYQNSIEFLHFSGERSVIIKHFTFYKTEQRIRQKIKRGYVSRKDSYHSSTVCFTAECVTKNNREEDADQ